MICLPMHTTFLLCARAITTVKSLVSVSFNSSASWMNGGGQAEGEASAQPNLNELSECGTAAQQQHPEQRSRGEWRTGIADGIIAYCVHSVAHTLLFLFSSVCLYHLAVLMHRAIIRSSRLLSPLVSTFHSPSQLHLHRRNMAANAPTSSKSLDRISEHSTLFFLCDIQETFRDRLPGFDGLIATASYLTKAAGVLEIPVIVTEQQPFKATVKELDVNPSNVFKKSRFSMLTPDVKTLISEKYGHKRFVVLYGLEVRVLDTSYLLYLCSISTLTSILSLTFSLSLSLSLYRRTCVCCRPCWICYEIIMWCM